MDLAQGTIIFLFGSWRMVKNWLVNRNVFFLWPTRMLIQEYVLLGKFTFLLHSTTALTISLFILAQLLLETTRHFNYWDKKGEKNHVFFLFWRPCHNTCCNMAHIGIASTEAKSQLVSNKRTSVWDKQHKHLICADRGYKPLALDSLTLNCAKTSSINPHNCVLP